MSEWSERRSKAEEGRASVWNSAAEQMSQQTSGPFLGSSPKEVDDLCYHTGQILDYFLAAAPIGDQVL